MRGISNLAINRSNAAIYAHVTGVHGPFIRNDVIENSYYKLLEFNILLQALGVIAMELQETAHILFYRNCRYNFTTLSLTRPIDAAHLGNLDSINAA